MDIATSNSRCAFIGLLNGRSWCVYADGFKRAAELLITHVKDIYDINTVIFPILALYRQYVELTLKEIISYGQYLEGHEIKQGGHHLLNLWATAKTYTNKHYKSLSKTKLERIDKLLNDLYEIDPTSEATRYPCVKSKTAPGGLTPSFAPNTKPINLEELHNAINELSELFEEITTYMSVCEDLHAEFMSDCYGNI